MAGSPENKGFVGLNKEINEKLRNAELVGAGVLAVFGQFGWAGVLAVAAGIDHAQVKLAEWWQNRGKKSSVPHHA